MKEKEKEGQQQLSLEGVKTTPYFSLPVSTKEGRKVFIISKATRGNHPLETAEILPRVIVQTPEIPPSETKKKKRTTPRKVTQLFTIETAKEENQPNNNKYPNLKLLILIWNHSNGTRINLSSLPFFS